MTKNTAFSYTNNELSLFNFKKHKTKVKGLDLNYYFLLVTMFKISKTCDVLCVGEFGSCRDSDPTNYKKNAYFFIAQP